MVSPELIRKLFSAAYIKRWNDKLRPIDFVEFDKAAHKMFIAYILGACEERKEPIVWRDVIEGGLFSLLQKVVLTDLKPTVLSLIKKDPVKSAQLNTYVYSELASMIEPFGEEFCQRFRRYFEPGEETREKKILNAASILSTTWEFDIIERADPHGFETAEIKENLEKKLEQYTDLEGMKEYYSHVSLRHFVDLCGQLRFHERWAYVHRIPKTSVLSHCLFVGFLAYLFSLQHHACSRRLYNNFFAGLFHDFPETLTRDIVTGVKRSVEGLRDIIIQYEKSEMKKRVYPLLPEDVHIEVRMFTEIDDRNRVVIDGEERYVLCGEIAEKYNDDKYDPCEGELVKACDELTAFVEADEAIKNGCVSERFELAKESVIKKYGNKTVCGISLSAIAEKYERDRG
ncbi:HD domain-containing protein [Candidatus Uhrbacteria bacterium]|nr:HD domain-containing protein [Candidatus Uhrbacteria bacterium]